jgi:hypothetical protein
MTIGKGFRIEDLLNGKINKENFNIDYLPMWQMLDNLDKKLQGGLSSLSHEDIWKRIYDFAIISVSLDKADMQTRIDNLTEQNIKWFSQADALQAENEKLKQQLQEKLSSNVN